MVLHAVTTFLGAFLLFWLQPLTAQYLLPWFGGASAVWTACMLFYQVLLFAGYAYAHLLQRLPPQRQAIVHGALLVAAVASLPITPAAAWKPTGADHANLHILTVLAVSVGLPFFLLSSTGPLIQAWFRDRHPGRSPYRLYAVSNVASFLALLGYPVLLNPMFGRNGQAELWAYTFIAFVLLSMGVASVRARTPVPARIAEKSTRTRPRAIWFGLAACGTALLLATTNAITHNIAASPFLWVVPLALYLATFVLAFAGIYSPRLYAIALAFILLALYVAIWNEAVLGIRAQLGVYCLAIFVSCMVCHGELYRTRPEAAHLTGFYLSIAAGGAIGGLLVAVAAPLVFNAYYELPLAYTACALMLVWRFDRPGASARGFVTAARAPAAYAGVLLFCFTTVRMRPGTGERRPDAELIAVSRSFYGLLSVYRWDGGMRELLHGAITHGTQVEGAPRRATTYYGPQSGAALALRAAPEPGKRRVGLIGLGVGTLATYGAAGDLFRFYELDAEVVRYAREHFSYLDDSEADVEVVLGDARLSLEREEPQRFDVLIVDAFSSDAIPVHLLTVEAFEIYLKHLADGGLLAVHVSNRHVSLDPVVQGAAQRLGCACVMVSNADDLRRHVDSADWVILARKPRRLVSIRRLRAWGEFSGPPIVWTDDRHSLLSVLD